MKVYQTVVTALCALLLVGCSQTPPTPQQAKTPTEVMMTLNEASKNKDVEAIKKSVSKGTLELIEKSARAQNLSVDEMLKKENGAPFKDLPEMRNEKIEGEQASIELKNAKTNDWETVPFVKEDGAWRLALDKYLQDMQKKMAESMKTEPSADEDSEANVSASGNDKQPKQAANKLAKSKK